MRPNGMYVKTIAGLGTVLLAAGCAIAQTPAPPRSFEVATIKAAAPMNPAQMAQGKVHLGVKIDAARVDIGFFSIADLIRTAYEVKPYQVSGPDWITSERFDILAKMPEGATKEQVPAMLKALLADRFKLAVHKESREHPVYALVAGKNGPKLEPAVPDSGAAADAAAAKNGMNIETNEGTVSVNRSPDGKGAVINSSKDGGARMTVGADGIMHLEMLKTTMPAFADMLSRYVDLPVIDETGLKGEYHVSLDLTLEDMMRMAKLAGIVMPGMGPGGGGPGAVLGDSASSPGASTSVFHAVERLGLKLNPRREPVETIVVDHVERTPTAN
jgi:uncharacterized protein (TIGR03435 family)